MTDVVRQHYSASHTVRPLSAVLCDAHVPLHQTGPEIARVQGRFASHRSEMDFLDDDGLGESGEHAAIHDQRFAPWGDAAPSRLV